MYPLEISNSSHLSGNFDKIRRRLRKLMFMTNHFTLDFADSRELFSAPFSSFMAFIEKLG